MKAAGFWGGTRLGVPGTGHDNEQYVRPYGTADDGEFPVAITPTATSPVPGWDHTRLRVAVCAPNGYVEHDSGDDETLVVPLTGSFRVEVTEAGGATHDVTLPGRASVFDGPTDVVYAGRGARLRVSPVGPDAGRVALCGAPGHEGRDAEAVPAPHGIRGSRRAARGGPGKP